MKKMLKRIRRNVCRTIYYADFCPVDNRRNYRELAENALLALVMTLGCAFALVLICMITL